jgi:hypothetical protein
VRPRHPRASAWLPAGSAPLSARHHGPTPCRARPPPSLLEHGTATRPFLGARRPARAVPSAIHRRRDPPPATTASGPTRPIPLRRIYSPPRIPAKSLTGRVNDGIFSSPTAIARSS